MEYYLLLLLLFITIVIVRVLFWLWEFVRTDLRYYLYKLRPFPKEYEAILLRYFPLYQKLPRFLQKRLQACILVFIKEKEFVGVKLKIDETKKVLVAANACLLTIGHDRCMYKNLYTIYLYPETIVKKQQTINGWIVSEQKEVLLGEAWQSGEVVLSWRDLVAGDINPSDGKNVGLHEFAHQLDMLDGEADGTPPLPLKMYRWWTKVMQKEFNKLQQLYKKHKKGFLDYYAITNAAEFFAVATEAFFEKPKKLQKEEPQLYQALKAYYKLDPASWD